MRKYYFIKIVPACLLTLAVLSSCNKWLDIKPQTQIESNVAFEKETGFQDALTGVYIKMVRPALYGKELSFGMVDGLAAQFTGRTTGQEYYGLSSYQFTEADAIAKSEAAFQAAYNAIANINNLIVNINAKGPGVFSGVNYHVIRGEAYGLRAMLHFDLIRLYGSAIASQGSTKSAIPYMDTTTTLPGSRLTTTAFMNKVLADLNIAAAELKQSDPIVPGNEANTSTYLRDRAYKCNYYAVKSLQARAYLYAGNKTDALTAATEVINSNVFGWTPSSEIVSTNEGGRNRLFTQELIFNLTISNLDSATNGYFDETQYLSRILLSKSNTDYNELFPVNDDYRGQHLLTQSTDGSKKYSIKLKQYPAGLAIYQRRMPLIRKSELYYIAAECLAASNPQQAATYLNEVKLRRNAPLPSLNLTEAQVEAEITLEYRKEFICEGQLFYYYKRKNIARPPGINVNMSDATYVLPLPQREISYGL